MKAARLAVVAGVLDAALGLGGYYYYTRTPQYALLRIAKAYDGHKLIPLERYVELDAVTTPGAGALEC